MTREARREQILESATRAFVRGGYHGTHVDDVIREAGIARGTFYLYFDSKHAVFAALVEEILRVASEVRAPGAADVQTGPAEVEAFVTGHYTLLFREMRKRRDLWRLLLDEAVGADKGFTDGVAAYRSHWQRRVRDYVKSLAARGLARDDVDAETVAWMVVGMVEMAVRRYVLPAEEPDIPRLARSLAAFEMRGLLAPRSR